MKIERSKAKNKNNTHLNRSMRERAYLSIQQMIVSGDLKAGSSVSEISFAEKLGVSRTPIREAISQLVAEGLLDQKPNRGAVVSQITRQDIIDLYELREALEVYVVGKISSRPISRANLERLQNLINEILVLKEELEKSGQVTLDAQQMQRFVNCDIGFHSLLMHLAGNLRILKVVNESRLLIKVFAFKRTGHAKSELEAIYQHHSEILQALIKQDPELAKHLISEHIKTSMQERLEEFTDWEQEDSLQKSVSAFFEK